MVMITRGCEKKPQGVVSVTRRAFTVREVTEVMRYTLSRCGEAAALGRKAGSSDGFSSASSHVATLAWQ